MAMGTAERRWRRPSRGELAAALTLVGLVALAALGVTLGGELGDFVLAGLGSVPFALLGWLAYLGSGRRWARVVAVGWLTLVLAAAALVVLLFSWATFDPFLDELFFLIDVGELMPELSRLASVAAGLAGALVLAIAALTRPVRALAARVLPLDPGSFVHAVALAAVVPLTLMSFVPLVALGEPPMLTVTAREVEAGIDPTYGRGAEGSMRDSLYGLVWLVPGAVVAVGYGVRRGLADSLGRLGLVRPSRRQVALGIGLAVACVVFFELFDAAIAGIWRGQGWRQTDEKALEQLMASMKSPGGAVVIGVTAGLGEELAVRGALQPRLGLLLSNLFFTALHGFQYSWDALLSVFVAGMLLGVIRSRTNTTTSAIVHGLYDFLLIMAWWLDLPELV